VTGGGLDAGGLCAIGAICPANPIDGYAYSSGGAVSGSLAYNSSTDQADFTLTLNANTYFGAEELMAGSTFAATGISITVTSGTHGTETISLATPSVDGSTTGVNFISPTLGVTENNPLLSALTCSLTATGGQCGVSLGSVNGAANSLLLVDGSNNAYNAYLTFNVNVTPVPIPPALPLLLCGVAVLGMVARRRQVSLA
jgi:phage baseplate assembly protein gpV